MKKAEINKNKIFQCILEKRIFSVFLFAWSFVSFGQGSLFVKENATKYGYADAQGLLKIPCVYSFAYTDTLKTIAFVMDGKNKIIAINKSGKKLFTVYKIDNGPDYISEGFFRIVNDKTGMIGFADKDGKVQISASYFFARPFKNDLSAFNQGGKFVMNTVNGDTYTHIEGGKWGYIDKKGSVVFPAIFDKVSDFTDKEATVHIGNYIFKIHK